MCVAAKERNEESILLEKQAAKKQQLELLNLEQTRFPNDDDLRIAVKAFEDASYELERSQSEVHRQEEKAKQEEQKVRAIRSQAQELAEKVHLAPKLELFLEALEDSRKYKEAFHQLQLSHNKYQYSFHNLQNL